MPDNLGGGGGFFSAVSPLPFSQLTFICVSSSFCKSQVISPPEL